MSTLTIAQNIRIWNKKQGLALFAGFNKLSILSFLGTAVFLAYVLLTATGLFEFSSRSLILFAGVLPTAVGVVSALSLRQFQAAGDKGQLKGQGLSIVSFAAVVLYVLAGAATLAGIVASYFILS